MISIPKQVKLDRLQLSAGSDGGVTMNDPWDVKSVRQSGQYISCMKINGVPLLPPLLSKECREEMKYYKLLALEVQKRMSIMKPFVYDPGSSCSDYEDSTETELQVCDEDAVLSPKNKQISKIETSPKHVNNEPSKIVSSLVKVNKRNNISSPKVCNSDKKDVTKIFSVQKDVPERDYNCIDRVSRSISLDNRMPAKKKNMVHQDISGSKELTSLDPFAGVPRGQHGPASMSSKSFTGSLNDLYSESIKESLIESGGLVRQSSYTLLKPSPELLAHLEEHSQNTGIDMTAISMSESITNLSSPGKKRRNWDIERAKEKWSHMALELKQKNVVKNTVTKAPSKNVITAQSKSLITPVKRISTTTKVSSKSEAPRPSTSSLISGKTTVTSRVAKTDPPPPKTNENNCSQIKVHSPTEESDDPAIRVRKLYEKVHSQQLLQMANLVEKQKREQLLLQQVFDEQNNLLFKQLKTICPKSPIEVKEAWGEHNCENNTGPVSLSQVINYKSPDQSGLASPDATTLTDTNFYINHCDNVLKKSRDITSSLKKQSVNSYMPNGNKVQSSRAEINVNKIQNGSLGVKNSVASRKLNYDTSLSTDRDCEQILTDRTNDTMADLNVTFPSDHSDESNSNITLSKNAVDQYSNKEIKLKQGYSSPVNTSLHLRSTENAIKEMERTINDSMSTTVVRAPRIPVIKKSTAREHAAATKIIAHAKGYLVRRLMRTERVQGIVQTIKDALLCALQLHQDREGIRGADVDLHRRLIQQITAACYSLHDTFVASSPSERCAMIAADREKKKRTLRDRRFSTNSIRQTDIMSQSHSGSFPARPKRQPPSLMTQSNYETFSGDKSSPVSRRYMASPRRRPWR